MLRNKRVDKTENTVQRLGVSDDVKVRADESATIQVRRTYAEEFLRIGSSILFYLFVFFFSRIKQILSRFYRRS